MAATSVTELEASEPPEARGLRRDEVRLLVSDVTSDTIEHARFRDLPAWLDAGDVLVVNTSGTVNAALHAVTDAGQPFELHLSTPAPRSCAIDYGTTDLWIVELRLPGPDASRRFREAIGGMRLGLPAGGSVTLGEPFGCPPDTGSRLWMAELRLPEPWRVYLERYGFPIRYSYVPESWPLAAYQTVFAAEPGSAEMPSAGRPFSNELVTTLVSRGVQFAPIVLHTGVSSLEEHEPPYEEYFRVTRATADVVNAARHCGSRVVGVGTTAVRALETVTDPSGITRPGEGWTSLVVDHSHILRSVDSMITGLHEPRASHLMMLDRVVRTAGHLNRAYAAARHRGYLWHEFGDSHLILGR